MKKQLEDGENMISLQQEANLFVQYLEREISCSDRHYTTGESLIFFHGNDYYNYKRVGQTMVRQFNGDGYITVCYNVEKIQFTSDDSGITTSLTLKKGKESWSADAFLPKHTAVVKQ